MIWIEVKMNFISIVLMLLLISCNYENTNYSTPKDSISNLKVDEVYLNEDDPIFKHSIILMDDINPYSTRCSGVLVAPNVVLTAGHCTGFATGDTGTFLHISHKKNINEKSIALPIQKIVIPKKYSTSQMTDQNYDKFEEMFINIENRIKQGTITSMRSFVEATDFSNSSALDLALLYFEGNISAKPILISNTDEDFVNKKVFAAGYGYKGRTAAERQIIENKGIQILGILRKFFGFSITTPANSRIVAIAHNQNEPQSYDSGGPIYFITDKDKQPILMSLQSLGPITGDEEAFKMKVKNNIFGSIGPDLRFWKPWIECHTGYPKRPDNCNAIEASLELSYDKAQNKYIAN